MIGSTLSHYRIDTELGRGGMGIVYRALDERLDREVALKVLPASALANSDDRARFYREARAAAALNHANIATVYEIDEAVPEGADRDEPRPFIAMELIDGESLEDRIKQGPLKLDVAVRISSEVASGLDAAHEKGIVHRDIKASNVMLTAKQEAKILDFGLALTSASTRLTRQGATVGTVAYMSPEQARGEEVDQRTDIWSLGVVLYEMIAGRLPFAADYEQAALYAILNEDPDPLTSVRTGVPMGLEWIVSKCLSKEAADRYQSARELLVDLRNVDVKVSGMSRISRPTTPVPQAGPQEYTVNVGGLIRRHPIAAGATLLVAGVVVGILLGPTLSSHPPDRKPVIRTRLYLPDATSPLQAAVSPDDRYLYYVAFDSSERTTRLAVYDFELGSSRQIARTRAVVRPIVSPDGNWVAYLDADRRIWRMPSGGQQPIRVVGAEAASLFSFGSFTGDGRILFGRTDWQTIDVIDEDGQARVIANRDSTRMQQFILAMTAAPSGGFVTWSDFNGNSIPFDSWLLRRDHDRAEHYLPGAWVHTITTSGHLLFARGHIVRPQQTVAMPIDLRTGKPKGVEFPLGWWSRPVAVSPSGLMVYEELTAPDPAESDQAVLSRVSASGTAESILEIPNYNNGHFAVSGDGRFAAVVREMTDYDQLDHVDLSTGVLSQIARSVRLNVVSWSRGTGHIYFDEGSDNTSLTTKRRSADLTGTNDPVLPDLAQSVDPFVSQDGSLLVFKYEGDIWGTYLGSDSVFAITDDDIRQDNPKVSPDGRYVAYQQPENCGSVNVIPISERAESIEIARAACHFDWSADGRFVYYQHFRDISRVPVETSPSFRIAGPPQIMYSASNTRSQSGVHFDLSDDGTLFVLERDDGNSGGASGPIWLVMNWFEELNRLAPHTR